MHEIIAKMITRHAIRRFEARQVAEDALQQVLTAGLYAPSAGNNQRSRIVVCQDAAVNRKLGEINRWMQFKGRNPAETAHPISAQQPSIQDDFTLMDGYYGAPTVLTIFVKNHQYAREDAVVMAENMLLAAHFLGLGACYIRPGGGGVRHGIRPGIAPKVGRAGRFNGGVLRSAGVSGGGSAAG